MKINQSTQVFLVEQFPDPTDHAWMLTLSKDKEKIMTVWELDRVRWPFF